MNNSNLKEILGFKGVKFLEVDKHTLPQKFELAKRGIVLNKYFFDVKIEIKTTEIVFIIWERIKAKTKMNFSN